MKALQMTMMARLLAVVMALLPLLIALIIKKRLDEFSQPCVEDPLVTVQCPFFDNDDDMAITTSIQPCRVFSSSYQQARQRFRDAVQRIDGAHLVSLPVTAAAEQEETMDIAVLPGNVPGLVFHSSGTHGVEGFAGSAIQVAYLEAAAANVNTSRRRNSPTVVLIHAVNPWGMARFRRTNENNVDLNRNALTAAQWKQAVHHVNHNAYQTLETLLNPAVPPMGIVSHLYLWLRALPTILAGAGPSKIKAALVGGQYYNPKGVMYGGSGKLETSWRVLEEWLTTFLASRRQDKNSTTDVVTWIDVHTGLGDLGVDTFLFHPAAYETMEQVQLVVRDVLEHFPETQTPLAGLSQHAREVMQGYQDNVMGFSTSYFLKLFHPQQKPILGAQEFGTVPSILVAHALFCENSARHYFSIVEGLTYAQQTTKRAFYPDNIEWRHQVITRGLRVLWQAEIRSSRLSPSLS